MAKRKAKPKKPVNTGGFLPLLLGPLLTGMLGKGRYRR